MEKKTTRPRWSRKEIAKIRRAIKENNTSTLIEISEMLAAEMNRPKLSIRSKVYEYAPTSRFQRKHKPTIKDGKAKRTKKVKAPTVDKSFGKNVKPAKKNGAILEITNIKKATFTDHKTLVIELI